jgi:hypothetical protein
MLGGPIGVAAVGNAPGALGTAGALEAFGLGGTGTTVLGNDAGSLVIGAGSTGAGANFDSDGGAAGILGATGAAGGDA